ncbi:hypothetical protein [Streptomyces sp. NPDC086989]|uniref:hypothetical protein n=1 Tax=Streptomyces sp. NPDC086989 TaxID=3365764 RepID=UPI003806FA27
MPALQLQRALVTRARVIDQGVQAIEAGQALLDRCQVGDVMGALCSQFEDTPACAVAESS